MADTPEAFRYSGAIDLLKNVHAAWDEIHFIDGYPGEFCCLARRKGDEWFVAGINAAGERLVSVDFSFLPPGNYSVKSYTDDKHDEIIINFTQLNNKSTQTFELPENGGFVVHLYL
jgi:alpha-glucosidase